MGDTVTWSFGNILAIKKEGKLGFVVNASKIILFIVPSSYLKLKTNGPPAPKQSQQ
jgi:hypothetical protein